ncbi:alpha/beta fold hydrolase [Permianibacter aggregans]|uniref:AB hydrolase-1 domain-containing protein n=2 Tax=Permianibacter aggregans TaxID=1510150 RepID=A0A4R6UR75_9GAMM|nr:alpha/beta fold hydrolase [Permianibacter aggregans]TDQ49760.1 hypothetical protein EV696_103129 [Permianibacter aggregans]
MMNHAVTEPTMLPASLPPFAPKGWLRNPHLQGIVSRLPHRRKKVLQLAQPMLNAARPMLLQAREGQLLAWHSAQADRDRPLVVLLHGWEGSSDSLYLLATAAELFDAGYSVLRLNLRDHGESHHLNEELFHSCRDAEVTEAIADARQRLQASTVVMIGFSLGGNFALRVALRAPELLQQVFAVCPVISPPATLDALETGPLLYRKYFLNRWRDSLRRKQAVHPEFFRDTDWLLKDSLTSLTDHFVRHHTDFGELSKYLAGYTLSAERLANLTVPSHVIIAEDDPVIPAVHWHQLQKPEALTLESLPYGGHCGFVLDWAGTGWIERYLGQLLRMRLAPTHKNPI